MKYFNTAGPCRPDEHYMLPPGRRLQGIEPLIERGFYFAVHAPRQAGKTTAFRALALELVKSGHYAALLTSCESGQKLRPDLPGSIAGILAALAQEARTFLPPRLQPPEADPSQPPENRLRDLLARWASSSPLPVVLFFDEIDALYDDALISVLRQLRSGYSARPAPFAHSVALIGLRDVRDYKISSLADEERLGSSSPFNIKIESITLRNFLLEEVAELYGQYTQERGQIFEEDAIRLAFEKTGGQPWLVNALAREVVEGEDLDLSRPIGTAHIAAATERLIARRDTHLDSLIERLREPRVRRVIAPILAGELILGDRIEDDIAYVEDLGLVSTRSGHLQIANPIYHELIPRALAGITQPTVYHDSSWYRNEDGGLDFDKLLGGFVDFWRQHGEPMLAAQPYHEVAAQLVLMSFLQRVLNGGGTIDREYAVGRGRLDLLVKWPAGGQRFALELKTWRDGQVDPVTKGVDQLADYLERLGLREGTLVIFDQRKKAAPIAERGSFEDGEHRGLRLKILRL